MPITNLFHIAIKTSKPEATKRFYEQIFGMVEAARPAFNFPGYWMQLSTPQGGSILHLYTGDSALDNDGRVPQGTGAIDHIALSAHGFGETRQRLRTLGIPYRERTIPGTALWQLFTYDPNGVQFELNFHSANEAGDGISIDPENALESAGMNWFDPGPYRQFEKA